MTKREQAMAHLREAKRSRDTAYYTLEKVRNCKQARRYIQDAIDRLGRADAACEQDDE